MPELKRRTPCPQCPFLTKSLAGYLGASTAQDFLDHTMLDAEMPCHMGIDYSDPDWLKNQYPSAPLCVGALQFLNNQMKLPRPRKLADACHEVGQNPDVMSSPEQFMTHHDNETNRRFVATALRMEPGVSRDYPHDDEQGTDE